jgi:predicted Zn-dependent protease
MDILGRDNQVRATEMWTQALARFPDLAMKSPQALELLIKLRLYEDAEALFTKGLKRYPRNTHVMEALAFIAYKRGDREEALKRCKILRGKFPESLKGYWIAAVALNELDRPKEGEAMLAEGLRLMPEDITLRIQYAQLATHRRDWAEALKRWNNVYESSGHLVGAVGAANVLTETGRYDEADQLLSNVIYKAGNEIAVWIGLAYNSEHKQDWIEAAKRWDNFRRRFPRNSTGYIRGLRPLLAINAHDEADAIIRDGIERIADDPALLIEYASLAHRRKRWDEAAQRWATLRARFPQCHEGYEREADALEALGQKDDAARVRAAQNSIANKKNSPLPCQY